MDSSILKQALDEWQKWFQNASISLKTRETSLHFIQKNALAITGVRRCGKTYLSVDYSIKKRNVHPHQTFYFNFEDPISLGTTNPEILDSLLLLYSEHYGGFPSLVILDEIQNVKGWEKWVRKQVDLNHFQIIVTGSSAKLLSSELASSLTGRCIEQVLWPLSFREYFKFIDKPKPSTPNEALNHLHQYMKWGGFPDVVLQNNKKNRVELLKQYLIGILYRDVLGRHELRSSQLLEKIVLHYLTNISSLHSYTSLRKAYGVPTNTAAEYTRMLEEAFLTFEVGRYHPNLKVQTRDPKKIYAVDTGLRNINSFSSQEDIGKLAENIVFIELKRRQHEVTYFKGNKEVDFVITRFGKPLKAIQVCYSDLEKEDTKTREIEALIECLQTLRLHSGLILTRNREEKIKTKKLNIQFLPLYRWLLK